MNLYILTFISIFKYCINYFGLDISNSELKIKHDNKKYFIEIDGRLLLTPLKKKVKSSSLRLIEHILFELECEDKVDHEIFNFYSLYCLQVDFIENTKWEKKNFRKIFLTDPVLCPCAGPERRDQFIKWRQLLYYFELNDFEHPNFPQLLEYEKIEEWVSSRDKNYQEGLNRVIDYFFSEFLLLNNPQKTVAYHSWKLTGSIVYGILLASFDCGPYEYSAAILASHCIIPNVFSDVTRNDYKEPFYQLKIDSSTYVEFINSNLQNDVEVILDLSNRILSWDILPEVSKISIIEASKMIQKQHSDYSAYIMLLGKTIETVIKTLIFDKFLIVNNYKVKIDSQILVEKNHKAMKFITFVSKEPHFIELGSMLFILELKGGKTELRTPILKKFYEFVETQKLEVFLNKNWLKKAKLLSGFRNYSSHSKTYGKKTAKELLNETIQLLNFYKL